jgi:acetyl-CoA C-acetyltransferase
MGRKPISSAYVIAARRTALGRIGGLHRSRRIEALSAPVVAAALADARITAAEIDEVIVGNASQGGNPARVVALAAGLPETVSASTIDRQCGSGLDAVLAAIRLIDAGEASAVVAGGAESLSTAPWRIAKPRSLYQLPHFIGVEPASAESADDLPQPFEASEALARRLGIGRARQDAYALRAHAKAAAARKARRFVGEIVPLRASPEEARDQSAGDPAPEDLERETPFLPPAGTLTPANTSALHDGAAFLAVVDEARWRRLGAPPALRLVAASVLGVTAETEAQAPIAALTRLHQRLNGFDRSAIGVVEMSESSAAQAIALMDSLGIEDAVLNPDGGAVARGHPLGAAGAVLVTRLFTRLVRSPGADAPRYGVATLGTFGGLGLAALFEAIRPDT